MDFSPYHSFTGCSRIEREIEKVSSIGNVTRVILEHHHTYHFSLIHRLRSARFYTDSLKDYLERQDTLDEEPVEVAYHVNHHFDGFLHSLGSALDVFAREVLSYFNLLPATGNVYFSTARKLLSNSRPGDPLIARLADPPWLSEFRDYRNTATHESIIGTQFEQTFEIRGNTAHSRRRFPLPDDPRVPQSQRIFVRNPDIVIYCEKGLKKCLRLLNPVYNEVADRVRSSQRLPL